MRLLREMLSARLTSNAPACSSRRLRPGQSLIRPTAFVESGLARRAAVRFFGHADALAQSLQHCSGTGIHLYHLQIYPYRVDQDADSARRTSRLSISTSAICLPSIHRPRCWWRWMSRLQHLDGHSASGGKAGNRARDEEGSIHGIGGVCEGCQRLCSAAGSIHQCKAVCGQHYRIHPRDRRA